MSTTYRILVLYVLLITECLSPPSYTGEIGQLQSMIPLGYFRILFQIQNSLSTHGKTSAHVCAFNLPLLALHCRQETTYELRKNETKEAANISVNALPLPHLQTWNHCEREKWDNNFVKNGKRSAGKGLFRKPGATTAERSLSFIFAQTVHDLPSPSETSVFSRFFGAKSVRPSRQWSKRGPCSLMIIMTEWYQLSLSFFPGPTKSGLLGDGIGGWLQWTGGGNHFFRQKLLVNSWYRLQYGHTRRHFAALYSPRAVPKSRFTKRWPNSEKEN